MSNDNYHFKYEEKLNLDEPKTKALVSVIMGSRTDLPTMLKACEILNKLKIPWEKGVVSAHRTPDRLDEYAVKADSRGLKIIITGAGGAAHLPGTVAAKTLLPVHGVPILTTALRGVDSVWSILQMPRGVPTVTFSIGEAGAVNAALQAVRVLALYNISIRNRLTAFIEEQSASVKITTEDD